MKTGINTRMEYHRALNNTKHCMVSSFIEVPFAIELQGQKFQEKTRSKQWITDLQIQVSQQYFLINGTNEID